ncbi:MAG: hypothetical protein MUP04_06700 [Anaerolineae bacterium]|nr:hypothetical protein [Anaerolineae bacterium]
MSILVVQMLPQGIIFGADRNITVTRVASDSSGRSVTFVLGQSQRPKVLRWPNKKALIGYVGVAEVGGIPTDEWLYEYIGNHLEFPSFETLAYDLTETIQEQRALDEGQNEPEALVLQLAGFEERDAQQVPVVWYIRNPHGMRDGFYTDIRKEFLCSEEFWKYFPNIPPNQIRDRLNRLALDNRPFWFHQGLDLGTFNTLDRFLRGAFALLCQAHPAHSFPQTLPEWEQHLNMAILTYGAYYQAFREPGEQYVGGGADTVSLIWPEPGAIT